MNIDLSVKIRAAAIPVLALCIGLSSSLVIAAIVGESPFKILEILLSGALGSATKIGYSLFYATPLLLTGLSVAWAFRAGLFNIGADGQMTLGGVAMSIVGICLPDLPWFVAIPLALVVAFATGGAWGAIAGWIKAKRGCHEVLTTILLNFIAYGIAGFLILSVFKNPESQVPETAVIGSGYQIPSLGGSLGAVIGGTSPLNLSLGFSLLMVAAYGFIFKRTRLGFYQKIAGGAAEVGELAGIRVDHQTILAMFISGGIAGLAAISPVLGFAFKTREGFAGNVGFVGIAVALLGRNSPMGIVLAALLFGVLTKGALDLDLDTKYVSRDLATVIQAFIVLAVASQAGLSSVWSSLLGCFARGAK
jgi:simple sugar transport system permease protein